MAFKKSSSTTKLAYTRRSFEATKKRAEQSSGMRDQYLKDHVSVWKPADGENCIRILPPTWEDAQHYGIDIFMHYGVGPDNSAFLDLHRMRGEPDPISEAFDRAQAEGDEEYTRSLRSVKRVLVYIIDRDEPKEGPQLWAMPWTVDKDISTQSIDSRSREILYIDDPDEGYDVYITREGQGERTRYSVKIARNSSSVELEDSWIELIQKNPLPECLIFYDYDHIKKVFTGKAAVTEDKKSAKTFSKKKPVKPSWNEAHQMDGDSLIELADAFELELDADNFDSEEEFADAICELLEITKPGKLTREFPKKFSKPTPQAKEKEEEEEEEEEDNDDEEEEEPVKPPQKVRDVESSAATTAEPEKKLSVRDRLAKMRGA